MAEVRLLESNGYISHGNWTLGQACAHLADWMRFPMDGFPVPPLPVRAIFWVMKKTVIPGMRRKILSQGFKGGMMTAPETVHPSDQVSDQAGIERLQDVVDRFAAHTGPLHPSPLFGEMDVDLHTQVTMLHAEHHLGYLEPQ